MMMEINGIGHESRALEVVSERSNQLRNVESKTIRKVSKGNLAGGGISAPLDHGENRTLISTLGQV